MKEFQKFAKGDGRHVHLQRQARLPFRALRNFSQLIHDIPLVVRDTSVHRRTPAAWRRVGLTRNMET
jgi:hypothetical protein